MLEGKPGPQPFSVYGTPVRSGKWERLFAAINPKGNYTFTLTVKTGKSVATSSTEETEWKVSKFLSTYICMFKQMLLIYLKEILQFLTL